MRVFADLTAASPKVYKMKVLLVEDSKFLRLATGRALTHAGHEMSFAGDGDEALLMAAESRPDLILLDMMLFQK